MAQSGFTRTIDKVQVAVYAAVRVLPEGSVRRTADGAAFQFFRRLHRLSHAHIVTARQLTDSTILTLVLCMDRTGARAEYVTIDISEAKTEYEQVARYVVSPTAEGWLRYLEVAALFEGMTRATDSISVLEWLRGNALYEESAQQP